ncbi:MAG: hypothetical protein IMHGJWDQ_000928 [Candidatus Fervidibacter sp.]
MVWLPQLYPPKKRITVHSLRLMDESLQPGEQSLWRFCADCRDNPPLSGLKRWWMELLTFWLYWLWDVAAWGEPRMVLLTDRRLLLAVGLDLQEVPFAAIESIAFRPTPFLKRETWEKAGLEVGEIIITYEGGQRLHLCVYRPKMVMERLQQAWENWKQQQQALLIRQPTLEQSEEE